MSASVCVHVFMCAGEEEGLGMCNDLPLVGENLPCFIITCGMCVLEFRTCLIHVGF